MKNIIFIRTIIIFVSQFYFCNLNAQLTIDQLFENTYKLYESQRYTNGIYRDAKVIHPDSLDYQPCSVANVGTGLISLCIADKAGFISDAETKAIQTLETILGHTQGFIPDRNKNGFYRHWIDVDTGFQKWNSEYSTIDSALLSIGALFAKKYFDNNKQIAAYADEIFLSIDWSAAIKNASEGTIWLEMDKKGNGKGYAAAPFNEYIIVAYLAMKSENNKIGKGRQAWEVWRELDNFAYGDYSGYKVLSDQKNPNAYISDFVMQFPYYLIPWAHNSDVYKKYMKNALLADRLYYKNLQANYAVDTVKNYEWGLGAGSSPKSINTKNYTTYGYNADDIDHHPAHVVSPHIIAGFLPIYSSGKKNLKEMIENKKGLYKLQTGETVLWRYSLDEVNWKANEIQGIDYSSMLYGLAFDKFGSSFFLTYNDYDFQMGHCR